MTEIDRLFIEEEGATPLSEEEKLGLIPTHITLRSELNEAEQENIIEAETKLISSTKRIDILDITSLKKLHKNMFYKVWKWAGEYRTTGKNIGIDAYKIHTALAQLIDDTTYHIENAIYAPEEIAVRFHHHLVAIHPFPNGNGRHARLAADLLCLQLDIQRFSWGGAKTNVIDHHIRNAYIDALRAADEHDIAPLLNFVRS